MRLCVYPGSFDPITCGHVDIIERAARLCDTLVVAVLHNPEKQGCFPVAQRLEMIRRSCAHIPNLRVESFPGLLVDYVRETGADCVIRGMRTVSDFEHELQMAQANRRMEPRAETLFLAATPSVSAISSSLVRQIAAFGGDVTPFVPPQAAADILQRFANKRRESHAAADVSTGR